MRNILFLGLILLINSSLQASTTFIVNTSDDILDSELCGNNTCSLREAVLEANNSPGRDIIEIDAFSEYNLYLRNRNVPEYSQSLSILEDLEIRGRTTYSINSPSIHTKITTNDWQNAPLFSVRVGIELTLKDIEISDFENSNGAGAVSLFGQASLLHYNGRYSNNISGSRGGAISGSSENIVTLEKVTLENNSSEAHGGAVYLGSGGRGHFTETFFKNNSAKNTTNGAGGALSGSDGSILIVKSSSFINNKAESNGGAIHSFNGTVGLINVNFENNLSQLNGGALNTLGSDILIMDSNYNKNIAENGGAIHSELGQLIIATTDFTRNTSQESGGAISLDRILFASLDSVYMANVAYKDAGAIIASSGSLVSSLGNTYERNAAISSGGAIALLTDTLIYSNKDTFKRNHAIEEGGAIKTINEANFIENANFIKNTTDGSGGAIVSVANLLLRNSFLFKNEAMTGGALNLRLNGIRGETQRLGLVLNSTFEGNDAKNGVGHAILSAGAIGNKDFGPDRQVLKECIHCTFFENGMRRNGETTINHIPLFEDNSVDSFSLRASIITGSCNFVRAFQSIGERQSCVNEFGFENNLNLNYPRQTIEMGPLDFHGGFTKTRSIWPGHIADSRVSRQEENGACLSTDQRGISREDICDTGAYELTEGDVEDKYPNLDQDIFNSFSEKDIDLIKKEALKQNLKPMSVFFDKLANNFKAELEKRTQEYKK